MKRNSLGQLFFDLQRFASPDGGAAGAGNGGEPGGQGTDPGQGGQPGAGQAGGDKTVTMTQAELDRIIQERLTRQKSQFGDYDDLKKKAARLDEIEKSQMTEAEKANARAKELEDQLNAERQQRTALELQAAKATALREAGIPETWANRIQGTTPDEIKADVEALKALIPGAGQQQIGGASNPPGNHNKGTDFRTASKDEFAAEARKYGIRI